VNGEAREGALGYKLRILKEYENAERGNEGALPNPKSE